MLPLPSQPPLSGVMGAPPPQGRGSASGDYDPESPRHNVLTGTVGPTFNAYHHSNPLYAPQGPSTSGTRIPPPGSRPFGGAKEGRLPSRIPAPSTDVARHDTWPPSIGGDVHGSLPGQVVRTSSAGSGGNAYVAGSTGFSETSYSRHTEAFGAASTELERYNPDLPSQSVEDEMRFDQQATQHQEIVDGLAGQMFTTYGTTDGMGYNVSSEYHSDFTSAYGTMKVQYDVRGEEINQDGWNIDNPNGLRAEQDPLRDRNAPVTFQGLESLNDNAVHFESESHYQEKPRDDGTWMPFETEQENQMGPTAIASHEPQKTTSHSQALQKERRLPPPPGSFESPLKAKYTRKQRQRLGRQGQNAASAQTGFDETRADLHGFDGPTGESSAVYGNLTSSGGPAEKSGTNDAQSSNHLAMSYNMFAKQDNLQIGSSSLDPAGSADSSLAPPLLSQGRTFTTFALPSSTYSMEKKDEMNASEPGPGSTISPNAATTVDSMQGFPHIHGPPLKATADQTAFFQRPLDRARSGLQSSAQTMSEPSDGLFRPEQQSHQQSQEEREAQLHSEKSTIVRQRDRKRRKGSRSVSGRLFRSTLLLCLVVMFGSFASPKLTVQTVTNVFALSSRTIATMKEVGIPMSVSDAALFVGAVVPSWSQKSHEVSNISDDIWTETIESVPCKGDDARKALCRLKQLGMYSMNVGRRGTEGMIRGAPGFWKHQILPMMLVIQRRTVEFSKEIAALGSAKGRASMRSKFDSSVAGTLELWKDFLAFFGCSIRQTKSVGALRLGSFFHAADSCWKETMKNYLNHDETAKVDFIVDAGIGDEELVQAKDYDAYDAYDPLEYREKLEQSTDPMESGRVEPEEQSHERYNHYGEFDVETLPEVEETISSDKEADNQVERSETHEWIEYEDIPKEIDSDLEMEHGKDHYYDLHAENDANAGAKDEEEDARSSDRKIVEEYTGMESPDFYASPEYNETFEEPGEVAGNAEPGNTEDIYDDHYVGVNVDNFAQNESLSSVEDPFQEQLVVNKTLDDAIAVDVAAQQDLVHRENTKEAFAPSDVNYEDQRHTEGLNSEGIAEEQWDRFTDEFRENLLHVGENSDEEISSQPEIHQPMFDASFEKDVEASKDEETASSHEDLGLEGDNINQGEYQADEFEGGAQEYISERADDAINDNLSAPEEQQHDATVPDDEGTKDYHDLSEEENAGSFVEATRNQTGRDEPVEVVEDAHQEIVHEGHAPPGHHSAIEEILDAQSTGKEDRFESKFETIEEAEEENHVDAEPIEEVQDQSSDERVEDIEYDDNREALFSNDEVEDVLENSKTSEENEIAIDSGSIENNGGGEDVKASEQEEEKTSLGLAPLLTLKDALKLKGIEVVNVMRAELSRRSTLVRQWRESSTLLSGEHIGIILHGAGASFVAILAFVLGRFYGNRRVRFVESDSRPETPRTPREQVKTHEEYDEDGDGTVYRSARSSLRSAKTRQSFEEEAGPSVPSSKKVRSSQGTKRASTLSASRRGTIAGVEAKIDGSQGLDLAEREAVPKGTKIDDKRRGRTTTRSSRGTAGAASRSRTRSSTAARSKSRGRKSKAATNRE